MKITYLIKPILTFLFFICLILNKSYGQSYGLGFYSHEVDQEKRTSLDLSPNSGLCLNGNFDIFFNLSFLPGHNTYYGYIIRIIQDDQQNFDLIYDNEADVFNFIIGDKISRIKFSVAKDRLFKQWNKFQISFDFENNQLIFRSGNKSYIEKNVRLKKNGCYKILFGSNNYKQFGTTDVPPMNIADVKIAEQGVVKYYWPLDEKAGLVAHENISHTDGVVKMPLWNKAGHSFWRMVREFTSRGAASVAFNANREYLYIVGSDSLFTYAAKNETLSGVRYADRSLELNIGNQSVFNTGDSVLYNFFPDQKFVTAYNPSHANWSKKHIAAPITNFIHVNKFVSYQDSSLYIIGGYGHHTYKNDVQCYRFRSGEWNNIKVKGDFFVPRYLAALGTNSHGDTAYILGGYGSSNGQQILNPKSLYDMMRFDVKQKSFKKLFDLDLKEKDLTFANSLVIDEKNKSYFGLIFPELKYESNLRLIKGSLLNNSYVLLGDSIPFAFNDLKSFADVYYCKDSHQFLAVTLLRATDNQSTQIKIYALLSPPEIADISMAALPASGFWYWVAAGFFIIILLVAIVWNRQRVKRERNKLSDYHQNHLSGLYQTSEAGGELVLAEKEAATALPKAAVFLFGELQLITLDGQQIVNAFTPLTKELFLFLFIHSVKWGRGVSSEKLNETLWFDKDEKSARNNRSVNIAKLKAVLDQIGHCSVSRVTGYWKIDVDYNAIDLDYHNYLAIVSDKSKLDKQKIIQLSEITRRGNFLSNCEYEWLDQEKSEISNEIIDTYLKFAGNAKIQDDPEFLIKISDYIFNIDPVNEEAMLLKCRALVFLGKHSLAKSVFENFRREYKTIYGEEFKSDFNSVLKAG